AVLARELALCYTTLALVTDTDAGVAEGEGVTQEEVFAEFGRNVGRLRDLIFAIIATLPEERACPCPHALAAITLPFELPCRGVAGAAWVQCRRRRLGRRGPRRLGAVWA